MLNIFEIYYNFFNLGNLSFLCHFLFVVRRSVCRVCITLVY